MNKMMARRCSSVIVLLATLAIGAPSQVSVSDQGLLDGYSAQNSQIERDWEQKFRALPSAQNQRDYMERLSARPHHVGSPRDQENAEWILAKFREFGLDAHIESFDVLFPTPRERAIELVEPSRYTAKLAEPALSQDPTSNQQSEQLPTYNAYSIDGDVTAPLVYVNYGLPADYETLETYGVSVKGAIVIARYGNSWRGIKPKVAAEHGAVGCIIYSDPRDDGYFFGNVFPAGPMRPPDGEQRGSMMDFPSSWPGDPTTPDRGLPGFKRLAVKDAPSITKIPVLPVSYGDAQPLLAALAGPLAPEAWRGALPIPYHLGPGPAKVHLLIKSNWDIKKVYDVIARIPGSSSPGEWVVRGNHHDAWVNGAEDPISGQVALIEEARALGELLKQGWHPKRTIIYCAWDGEEPMLLGSTAWAETHGRELQEHAVIYINTDGNGRGYFGMGGSHILEHFINGVARDIEDPESKLSVFQRDRLAAIRFASNDDRKEIRDRSDLRIDAIGSGTDFTAFLDHLGVPSLNLEFGGEDEGGIYHSIYDDFYWYTHFSDVDFVYGRALSQTIGTAVLRISDADIVPYEFTGFADTIHKYVKELQTLLKNKQDEVRERNRQLDEDVFRATFDPRKPTVAPKREEVAPHLNFAPLENAADGLTRSAERYKSAMGKARRQGNFAGSPQALNALNQKLLQSERRLLDNAGLPRRPWYRHMIYAPGVYTGYGVKTIPGVREAIEQKRWQEAEGEIRRVAKVLEGEAELVNSAAVDVENWDAGNPGKVAAH